MVDYVGASEKPLKVALKVAKRSNHEQVMKANNTFGWARAEIIGGLTNAIFLLALCVIIILESIEKFIQSRILITSSFGCFQTFFL